MATFYAYYPSSAPSGSNPSVGTNGLTAPTSSTEIAGIDPSGNQSPLQTDASGYLYTNVQSSTLPAGAATAAKQDTGNTSLASIDGKITTCNTGAVVVSSSALPTGASTSALQTTGNTSLSSIDGKLASLGQKTMAGSEPVVIASDQSTLPVSVASLPLPSGAATSANQTTANTSLASIDGKLGSLGQKTMSGSAPVVIASDQSTVPVKTTVASAATLSNVNGSATNVTVLASNANRRMATFFNDSTAILYLKFGATASTTSYTVQLQSNGYYELPQPVYTGQLDGIWSSANGAVRVTEIT